MTNSGMTPRKYTAEQFQSIEQAIEKICGEVENLNENNYGFLSIVFHDLRNPLTYIKMSLDVLLTGSFGEIPPEQSELLQKASLQVDRLNKIIDDVLLNTKLDYDKLPFSFSSINLGPIIDEAITLNQPLIDSKNLSIIKEVSPDIPNSELDYKNLSVAMNYLINYCVKSTEQGEIKIRCHADQEKKQIHLSITDTSACIGQENIPDVFTPFNCFGMMAKNKEERTGLELSICKGIIDKHNGTLAFDTSETNGNNFTITLPL